MTNTAKKTTKNIFKFIQGASNDAPDNATGHTKAEELSQNITTEMVQLIALSVPNLQPIQNLFVLDLR